MHLIRPVTLDFVLASGVAADAPEWDAPTVFALGARVSRLGWEYVNSIAGNQSLAPELEVQELEGARWILAGPTNSRAFLDASPSSATVGGSPMVLEARAAERFTDVCLVNLRCSRCTVEIFDSGGSLTQTQTVSTGPEPVGDWWSWLHAKFHSSASRRVLQMNGSANSVIRITVEGPDPALGEVFAGRSIVIGNTLMDNRTRVLGRTFTSVNTNDFGRTTIQKRATTRDVVYHVHAKREGFDLIQEVLEELDGVRVVSFATRSGRPELINVGLLEVISLPIGLPDDFKFELTVKGLQ